MSKASADTLAVRISRTLADRIIAGEIEPGTRLRQDHIAEEFGASHVPVREAFRRLESQGLAVSEPPQGRSASPPSSCPKSRKSPKCAPRWKCWRCATPRRI